MQSVLKGPLNGLFKALLMEGSKDLHNVLLSLRP